MKNDALPPPPPNQTLVDPCASAGSEAAEPWTSTLFPQGQSWAAVASVESPSFADNGAGEPFGQGAAMPLMCDASPLLGDETPPMREVSPWLRPQAPPAALQVVEAQAESRASAEELGSASVAPALASGEPRRARHRPGAKKIQKASSRPYQVALSLSERKACVAEAVERYGLVRRSDGSWVDADGAVPLTRVRFHCVNQEKFPHHVEQWSKDVVTQAWDEYAACPASIKKFGSAEEALRQTKRLPTWWHDHLQRRAAPTLACCARVSACAPHIPFLC